MKSFLYLCADRGIPLPGAKGASIHVQSVCRTLVRLGLVGRVLTARPEAEQLLDCPLQRIPGELLGEDRELTGDDLVGWYEAGFRGEAAPDLLYERYSLWCSGGPALAQKLSVPHVLEVNSPLPLEAGRFRGLADEERALAVARRLFEACSTIVCVSEKVARWVRGQKSDPRGVHVIPNGVDEEAFHPCPDSRPGSLPPRDVPLLAFSGSFRPWHGLDDLLDAFERVVRRQRGDAHLVCVGKGPMLEGFQSRVEELGLKQRVHLPGHIPHEQVAQWLGGADVALAPYPDGVDLYFSPLKLFEYMALGLPVVSVDEGQIPEIVPHGERGLLCPPGSAQGLAEACVRLLEDAGERRRLGEAGRRWVLDHATWDRRVGQILEVARR